MKLEQLTEKMSRLNVGPKNGLTIKFGKFKCSKCKKQWHSALVWCNEEGDPKYDQKCKKCKTGVLPFEVSTSSVRNVEILPKIVNARKRRLFMMKINHTLPVCVVAVNI